MEHQSCCSDGSNPWHGSAYAVDGVPPTDDLTCTDTATAATLEAAPAPIVLDTMDKTLKTQSVFAQEGTYAACMKDAYNQQFHHDWATNKGSASFSFAFDAPRSGCYKLEEYHPGGDSQCSRYLPRNARLEVERNERPVQTFSINQAENPAQWNEIGSLEFSAEIPAKLVMRNRHDEQCGVRDILSKGCSGRRNEESCFWVVDAFRLSWSGETCGSTLPSFLEVKAKADRTTSVPSTVPSTMPKQEVVMTDPAEEKAEHWGSLKIKAHLSHSHDYRGGLSDDAAVSLVLKKHWNLLETSLIAHFGFVSVQILTVAEPGRRLAGVDSVNIRFVGQGAVANPSAAGFSETLQKGLLAANAGLVIVDAEVEWTLAPVTPTETAEASSAPVSASTIVIFVCVLLSFVASIGLLLYKIRARALANKTAAAEAHTIADELGKTVDSYESNQVPPSEESKDVSSSEAEEKPAGKEADLDMLDDVSVGSTKSPVSDLAGLEEGNSCEDKNEVRSQSSEEI